MPAREIRILLVDNHLMMRQGLRQLIVARPDLTVVGEALTGGLTMGLVRTTRPDLVVMSLNLREEGKGTEGIGSLLAEFPQVKIIVLSVHSDLEFVLQALHAGISGYVSAEHGSDELFRAIRVVMDSGLYLSPDISSTVVKRFLRSNLGSRPQQPGVVLSDRERLLLQLIADGKRNKEIAGPMALAVKSVETYRFRLMKKLGCTSTAALVRHAIRENIIQP